MASLRIGNCRHKKIQSEFFVARSTTMSKTICLTVLSCLVLISTSALAQSGVVDSTQNPNQLAALHWYSANQTISFTTGKTPIAFAFDGFSMWVVNFGDNTVSKLQANDGAVLGTFAVGKNPWAAASDGANIWVTNRGDATVSKLRASDGGAGDLPGDGNFSHRHRVRWNQHLGGEFQ